jgi:hypothetical protein
MTRSKPELPRSSSNRLVRPGAYQAGKALGQLSPGAISDAGAYRFWAPLVVPRAPDARIEP